MPIMLWSGRMQVARRALVGTLVTLLIAVAGCGRPSTPAPAPVAAPSQTPSQPLPQQAATPAPTPPPPLPTPVPPALPGTLWVMVENAPGAIPQAGLDQADLVFEVEAEGGISRFLAAFYQHAAAKIGPVRSARYYYLHLVKPYGGPLAHAGANADALSMLATDRSYQDLDEIYNSGPYFFRTPDRAPPHNLYTSTELLVRGAQAKGYRLSPLAPWPEGRPAGGDPARHVRLAFALGLTQVDYRWNGERYEREQNGAAHKMADGRLLAPSHVVVLFAAHGYERDYSGEDQRNIAVVGRGAGLVFSGGKVWPADWSKPAANQHLSVQVGGAALKLPKGQTWIVILPGPDHIRYEA